MRAVLFLISLSGFAASVGNVQVTATQALISVSYTGSSCAVVLYSDAARTLQLDDTNETLFPGSSQCARGGSAGNVFVAGLRTTQLASDGLWHSRALPANSTIYGTLTADTTINFSFVTANPPFGNTAAEPPPFNASAPNNYAWPTMRPILDRNKWFTDPQTGIQVNMWSKPVQLDPNTINGTVSGAPGLASFDPANNGNWTTPCAALGGSNCVNSTANTDPLFIRLTPYCAGLGTSAVQAPGSGSGCLYGSGTWGYAGSDETEPFAIDDIQINIKLTGSGATNSAQFALSTDHGVTPATAWQTQAVGSVATITYPVTGAVSGGSISTPGYPSTLYGTGSNATVFGYWGANTLSRPDMQPHTGTVSVVNATGVVTFQTGERFRPSGMSVGSFITLAGIDYRITAVTSPNSITIASPPADGTYNYIYQSFGVLVRKTTATTGSLTVGGVSYSAQDSLNNPMPIFGFPEIQSSYTVTDSGSHVLRPTMTQSPPSNHAFYVIDENTGFSRFIGVAESNGGCFTNACTPGVTSASNNFSQTSSGATGATFTQVPGHYILTALNGDSNAVLVDAVYNPAGSGSCPNDWQEITRANCPSYPYNDNITYQNATPKVGADTLDHTPVTVAAAYAIANSLAVFSATQLGGQFFFTNPIDSQNGWAEIDVAVGNQNQIGWFLKFDTTSIPFSLVAMGNTYSSYNCRFCLNHGSTSQNGLEGIGTESTLNAGSGVGQGPMVAQSTTTLGTGTPSTCSGITDPNYTSYNGTANCVDLTMSGQDLCHTTPNLGTEIAPMYGACSYNGSWTHLIGINLMVGDLMDDGSDTGEMFRVVKVNPPVITVLRNYSTPATITGQFARGGGGLLAHAANWTLRELCSASAGNAGGFGYFNLNTDPTAQNGISDYPTFVTSHSDWWNGNMDEAGRIRTGFASYPAQLGQPISFTANEYGPFNSISAAVSGSWVQSHGSLSRFAPTPNYELDANPFSSVNTNTNTLWTQNITNVSGQLWKIAAADVQNGGATWPAVVKSVPFTMWSGGSLIQDVSSAATGNVIGTTSADSWKFCIVWRVNECRTGSSVGDVYVNVPQSGATNGGNCGPWDYSRNICGITIDARVLGLNQYSFDGIPTYAQTGVVSNITSGSTYRKLSNLFNRSNFQSVYYSAHAHFGGSFAFAHSDYYAGGTGRTDLMLVKLPPAPNVDTISRNTFVQVSTQIGGGASGDTVRARFGYAENGAASALYCTSRQEQCSTAGAAPFVYVGDAQTWLACSGGCTVNLPLIPGRVAYYIVDRMNAAGAISSSELQVAGVP